MSNILESEKTKVTILSITYNHEKYIAEALDSFIKQETNFKYKVLIGDDASTDNTASIIKMYAEKYPDIIVPILRAKNVGIHCNVYDLLYQIDSDYIAYCEGDDYFISTDKLQKQVDFMEKNLDHSMCFHPVKVFYDENEFPDSIYPKDIPHSSITKDYLVQENFIQTNSVMWRKKNYQNMPSDIMPLDWYLHLYHAQNGIIGFLPQVMAAYRKHGGGVWSQVDKAKIIKKYGLGLIKFYYELFILYPNKISLLERIIKQQKRTKMLLSTKEYEHILSTLMETYPEIYCRVKRKKKFLPFQKIANKFLGYIAKFLSKIE